jgi:hypothetical protein
MMLLLPAECVLQYSDMHVFVNHQMIDVIQSDMMRMVKGANLHADVFVRNLCRHLYIKYPLFRFKTSKIFCATVHDG